jgi:hypothetical protein
MILHYQQWPSLYFYLWFYTSFFLYFSIFFLSYYVPGNLVNVTRIKLCVHFLRPTPSSIYLNLSLSLSVSYFLSICLQMWLIPSCKPFFSGSQFSSFNFKVYDLLQMIISNSVSFLSLSVSPCLALIVCFHHFQQMELKSFNFAFGLMVGYLRKVNKGMSLNLRPFVCLHFKI